MSPVERALRRLRTDLGELDRRWALVGGLAVSARAEPRTTRDVDAAVATEGDADAESLLFGLQNAGYRVVTLVEQRAAGRLATARLLHREVELSSVYIDLLFASSGIEPDIVAVAEDLEVLPQLSVSVAKIGHLIALKVLARDDRRRPQDADDIRALLLEATDRDRDDARRAVALIETRGFHRERPLSALLEQAFDDPHHGTSP